MRDWYQLQSSHFHESTTVRSFLSSHGDCIHRVALRIFPSHDWHRWRFFSIVRGLWEEEEERSVFFFSLGMEEGVEVPEDFWTCSQVWHRIKGEGRGLVERYVTVPRAMFFLFFFVCMRDDDELLAFPSTDQNFLFLRVRDLVELEG